MSDKQVKFYNRLLIILSIIIFLCAFLGSALSVNAAGTPAVDYPLPFIVQNENISGFSSFIENLSRANSSYAYYANRFLNGDTCFGYDYYESGIHKFRLIFPEDNFNYSFTLSTNYETFDYTLNRAEMSITGFSYISGYVEVYNNRYYFYGEERQNYPNPMTLSFFNGTNKGDGSMLVPNISTQNFNYDNDEYKPVFGFGVPALPDPEFNTGHAVEPEDLNPIDQDWSPRPQKPNFPTIINHIWNPAPTIDTTDIQSVLESIFDILQWFAQNVSDEFNNILLNIVNLIEFIGDLISYAVNAVIDTLVNIAKFLYDNFNQLFAAFFGSFLNFFEVIHDLYQHGLDENGNFSIVTLLSYLFIPDPDDFVEILVENDEFGFIPAFEHLFDVWSDFITTVRSLTYTYYITLPKFSLMDKEFGPYDIDFSWYLDYKVVGDGIISAFLILGYLYWLYTRFAGILRGTSGSIYDENKGDAKKAG